MHGTQRSSCCPVGCGPARTRPWTRRSRAPSPRRPTWPSAGSWVGASPSGRPPREPVPGRGDRRQLHAGAGGHHQLASEGLVEYVRGAGAYVRRIDRRQLEQLFDLRDCLEPFAARQAADHIDSEELREAHRLCTLFHALARELRDRPDQTADAAQWHRWIELEERFHGLVFHATRNPWVLKIAGELRLMALLFGPQRAGEGILTPSMAARTWREHMVLVRHLERGDGAGPRPDGRAHRRRAPPPAGLVRPPGPRERPHEPMRAPLLLAITLWPPVQAPKRITISSVEEEGPRILAVIAHPDDESAFAGAVFASTIEHGVPSTCSASPTARRSTSTLRADLRQELTQGSSAAPSSSHPEAGSRGPCAGSGSGACSSCSRPITATRPTSRRSCRRRPWRVALGPARAAGYARSSSRRTTTVPAWPPRRPRTRTTRRRRSPPRRPSQRCRATIARCF